MKDENVKTFNLKILQEVRKNLNKNGFYCGEIFDDEKQVNQYILKIIGEGKTIGVGGSQTIRSLGILEELEVNKNKIITHTSDMDIETRLETWFKAQRADFYLASPQAVTLNGELVFLDAYGNRVTSCILGPKKVILVCGNNKIVKDLDTAIWRTRNIAAVINNLRLKRQNPCVTTNHCQDCNSETRICNVLTILYKKPTYTEYEVILVNKSLGY